jgi:sec-independent protein translocase protein TatC
VTARGVPPMTFWEHLGELRTRIVWSFVAVALAAALAWLFRERIYDLLLLPLTSADPQVRLNQFAVTEAFFTFMRISLFAGLVLASPFVIYQAWAFVAPALKPNEKRVAAWVILPVTLLFAGGVAFVYIWLLPFSIHFLLDFAPQKLELELSQDKYFSFITGLCLAGGLLFELPVVLGLLGFLGLVSARLLWRYTGHALVILMIVAAVITPTGDVFNMLALTAPLLALYFLSILVVWVIQRAPRKKDGADGV